MEPKQQPPYPLRISPDLRARLEREAEQGKRSLNAEISTRLEQSFKPHDLSSAALLVSLADAQREAARHEMDNAVLMYSEASMAATLLLLLQEHKEAALKSLTAEEYAEAISEAQLVIENAQELDERVFIDDIVRRVHAAEARYKEMRGALERVAIEAASGKGAAVQRSPITGREKLSNTKRAK